jgi:hypothetical protein
LRNAVDEEDEVAGPSLEHAHAVALFEFVEIRGTVVLLCI